MEFGKDQLLGHFYGVVEFGKDQLLGHFYGVVEFGKDQLLGHFYGVVEFGKDQLLGHFYDGFLVVTAVTYYSVILPILSLLGACLFIVDCLQQRFHCIPNRVPSSIQ